MKLRDKMIQKMTIRNYSQLTIRSYVSAVKALAAFYKRSPDTLQGEEVIGYLYHEFTEKKLAINTMRGKIAGIRYFYHEVLGRTEIDFHIPIPRREKALPEFWSLEEIQKLLNAAYDPRFKTMILCCYAAGLRRYEVVKLRVDDIDSQNSTLWVRRGKGKKDRAALLTPTLLKALRQYWVQRKPGIWMFPSWDDPRKPISARGFSTAFRVICKQAGLTKEAGIHGLRHSFATHLIAHGTDIYTVQKLLGHSKLSTTQIYVHMSQGLILSKSQNLDLLTEENLNI